MKWSQSFIYITSFSYIGAIIMTTLGFPLMSGLSPTLQLIRYILGATLCLLAVKYNQLGYLMAPVYGVLAILSFSGVDVWVNYDGVLSLGPYMALWDLVLGIALLDNLETPNLFQ